MVLFPGKWRRPWLARALTAGRYHGAHFLDL